MIFEGTANGAVYTLTLRETSLTLSIDHQAVIAFDRGGRLYSLYNTSGTHRRGLNGKILRKWRYGDMETWRRCWLTEPEIDSLMDSASAAATQLLQSMVGRNWRWTNHPGDDALMSLTHILQRAAGFDGTGAWADARDFARIYSPIGILPPDQYLALVLQATEGCSFDTCTFCDLYGQKFRVKTPDEFDQHAQAVKDYLGDSLSLRQRSIFIGSANALAVPMARLRPLLDRASAFNANGLYAFVDGFTGGRKSTDDYRELATVGLRRVYVGLESGHDPLLEFVRKPGSSEAAIETVRAVKRAGLNAAVIVMIGLGGDTYGESHVADTARALNAMELGSGDLIYFSDLVESPSMAYSTLAAQRGIHSLSASELVEQRQAIRARLQFAAAPPKVSNYDIREFVY